MHFNFYLLSFTQSLFDWCVEHTRQRCETLIRFNLVLFIFVGRFRCGGFDFSLPHWFDGDGKNPALATKYFNLFFIPNHTWTIVSDLFGKYFYAINPYRNGSNACCFVEKFTWMCKHKNKNPLLIWTTRTTPNKLFNTVDSSLRAQARAHTRIAQNRRRKKLIAGNLCENDWYRSSRGPMWSCLHLSTTPLKQFVSWMYFNLLHTLSVRRRNTERRKKTVADKSHMMCASIRRQPTAIESKPENGKETAKRDSIRRSEIMHFFHFFFYFFANINEAIECRKIAAWRFVWNGL